MEKSVKAHIRDFRQAFYPDDIDVNTFDVDEKKRYKLYTRQRKHGRRSKKFMRVQRTNNNEKYNNIPKQRIYRADRKKRDATKQENQQINNTSIAIEANADVAQQKVSEQYMTRKTELNRIGQILITLRKDWLDESNVLFDKFTNINIELQHINSEINKINRKKIQSAVTKVKLDKKITENNHMIDQLTKNIEERKQLVIQNENKLKNIVEDNAFIAQNKNADETISGSNVNPVHSNQKKQDRERETINKSNAKINKEIEELDKVKTDLDNKVRILQINQREYYAKPNDAEMLDELITRQKALAKENKRLRAKHLKHLVIEKQLNIREKEYLIKIQEFHTEFCKYLAIKDDDQNAETKNRIEQYQKQIQDLDELIKYLRSIMNERKTGANNKNKSKMSVEKPNTSAVSSGEERNGFDIQNGIFLSLFFVLKYNLLQHFGLH
ncbi:hypothetical protein BDAP_001258 [Binucleata daphniae]